MLAIVQQNNQPTQETNHKQEETTPQSNTTAKDIKSKREIENEQYNEGIRRDYGLNKLEITFSRFKII